MNTPVLAPVTTPVRLQQRLRPRMRWAGWSKRSVTSWRRVTPHQVVEIVRHAARELVDAEGATFVLRDEGQCYYVDEDAIQPLWRGQRLPLDACISGWAMLHSEQA